MARRQDLFTVGRKGETPDFASMSFQRLKTARLQIPDPDDAICAAGSQQLCIRAEADNGNRIAMTCDIGLRGGAKGNGGNEGWAGIRLIRNFPDLDSAGARVTVKRAGRDQRFCIRAEGDGADLIRMPPNDSDALACFCIPQANPSPFVARSNYPAIRTEGYALQHQAVTAIIGIGVVQLVNQRDGLGIPNV